ncbi:pantoate--beta-alanine ligase [Thermogemmatispora onikobensis]|uniref:pantoate--beta-alanine ligase n=1 Tax=Thermogemmatispora onikobensis TaxID=732234 RepID=UPI000852F631|nr:pantoate--beta-alanine ligase [Thermogemmatispora onikobensis]
MDVITTVREMRRLRSGWPALASVGLVPTMGYLHEGHLSLVRRARAENDKVVVSIFVNPIQFGAHEDLERYPRDLSRDLHLLEESGVDAVLVPAASEMYPVTFITYVEPTGPLASEAEGASRPGHFRGVATVVLKLFNIVQPQRAYFGQKDAQQVAVIKALVADLNLPVELVIMPTVREPDGLAMSSRNSYLSPEGRRAATVLYRALLAGKAAYERGESDGPAGVIRVMREIVASEPLARLEYADVRDPETFQPLETLRAPALLLIAAFVEAARLIDNVLLRADGSWETGLIVPPLAS